MGTLCPKTLTRDNGVKCELFDEINEDDFGGLIHTRVCSYKCNDGSYVFAVAAALLLYPGTYSRKAFLAQSAADSSWGGREMLPSDGES